MIGWRSTPMPDAGSSMNLTLATRILVPFGIGYFLSYLFRVVNAVIAGDMSADLGLDADRLGLLTSAYFATFAAFQLPLGALLDRYGPRQVESILLLFAAAGAALFAMASSVGGLIAGRALVGLGVSACLMAAFNAYRRAFEADRLPVINGIHMAFGGLGAFAGTRPSAMLMEATDWRFLMGVLAAITVAAAVAIRVAVPRQMDGRTAGGASEGGFRRIYGDRYFWRIAPWSVFAQAAFLSIQSLWVGTWLRDVAGLEIIAASDIMGMMHIAMIGGFVLIGWGASRLAARGMPIADVAAVGMALFLVPQVLLIVFEAEFPTLSWLLFGFLGTGSIVSYAALSQHFPVSLSGRANTALKFMVFVAAFVEQWGLGHIINLWPAENGYEASGYRVAFALVLVLQVLAAAWYVALKPRPGAA